MISAFKFIALANVLSLQEVDLNRQTIKSTVCAPVMLIEIK